MNGEINAITPPCGVCRQVMREFCADDFIILLTDGTEITKLCLSDLLPYSFSPDNLSKEETSL